LHFQHLRIRSEISASINIRDSKSKEKKIKIRQVLDLAEIPTFQEQVLIDSDKNGTLEQKELDDYAERITPQILANLFLTVNDQPLALRVESNEIQTENGAGNLPTLKIKWNLSPICRTRKKSIKFALKIKITLKDWAGAKSSSTRSAASRFSTARRSAVA
jgi:hypothetical protein